MAVFSGPEIVNDGLVLHLDAANDRSYSGSGTTWTDLSGNGNHGTLVNGVGYSSDNNGTLTFDGVNDYVNCGNDLSLSFGSNNFSLSSWVKVISTSGPTWIGIIAKYNNDTGLWIQLNPSDRFVGFGWDGSSGDYMVSSTSVATGTWNYISCQRTSLTEGEIYVNGKLIMSSNTLPTKSSDTDVQLDVGRINISGRYFDGNISQVFIYNRALTANEIKQNFEATRSRYGI